MTADRVPGPGGGLVYAWPGPDPAPYTVPSVTTIVGAVSPGSGLVTWATRLVAAAATADPAALAAAVERDRDEATKLLAQTADRSRDAAASLGNRVHNAIAAGGRVDEIDDELRPYLDAWHAYLARSRARVVLAERTIWAPTFAGTFDAILELEGEFVLLDYKTGRTLLPGKLGLQLAAYAMGDYIGSGGVVDHAATDVLRRVERACVIHLRPELPDGLALYRIPIDEPVRAAWRAAVELYAFYRASRLVPAGQPQEDTMESKDTAAVASALEAAAEALHRAATALTGSTSAATPTPIRRGEGDRHQADHEPLRRNSRGLYCPTRLEDGSWCAWTAAA